MKLAAAQPLGKIAPDVFDALIAPHLGAARPEVIAGPRAGHDCAIVKIGAARVMSVSTDPLSIVPAWGLERSARLSCHLLASDLWTSGIPPAFAAVSLTLPPAMTDEDLARYWRAMSAEWAALGVAVIAGHTGRYGGLDSTVIGSATVMGLGDDGRYLTPAMARPGDRVIVTKGAAIETTAIAAHLFPLRLSQRLEPDAMERARAFVDQVSVVADCRAALRAGVRERGVTSLHDATEGGVLGGLLELAKGSGHDLRIERARIPLAPESVAACDTFGVDPWWTLSEGTLIATVTPSRALDVIALLAEENIAAADAGEVMAGEGVVWLTAEGGKVEAIREARPDPYWPAYERAVREGWK